MSNDLRFFRDPWIAALLKPGSLDTERLLRGLFRDPWIAALLKRPGHGATYDQRRQVFRDPWIAALLKPLKMASVTLPARPFPRSLDRGPIEAWICKG